MPLGYLCLVLHAHLPYVRHPEYDDFLEEDWFYEGITETYIPLLEMMDGLQRDGADWRLTMSVTPTLAAMFADPLLQYRYVRHIDNLIALASKEIERTRWQPEFNRLAHMYHWRFTRAREVFVNQYGNNLCNGFRRFFETGKLELITCCATHGFLPLMTVNMNAVRAQIEVGCREFERHFGKRPQGIWLAECGYEPGIDEVLRDCGLRYFFVDTHGVMFAEPRPKYGVYAPLICPKSGVAALRAIMNRPSRSGAPSRATPAIMSIASSTATSAGTSITTTFGHTCTSRAFAAIWASSTTRSPAAAITRSRTTSTWRCGRRPITPAISCSIARSRSSGSRVGWIGRR